MSNLFKREQLLFEPKGNCTISYNYQHEVMKNIYDFISICDKAASDKLHNEGSKVSIKDQNKDNKVNQGRDIEYTYKLFTHTLLFEKVKFSNNIKLNENSKIYLIISGKVDIVDKIVKGIKEKKSLTINSNTFNYVIDNTEKVFRKPMKYRKTMLYKTLSPVIETKRDKINSKVVNLTPFDDRYMEYLKKNLIRKYKAVTNMEDIHNLNQIKLTIENNLEVREKKLKIKNGYVKGYQFNIWIEAPIEIQKVAYYLGLGQKNSSLGAGVLSYIVSR